MCEAGFAVVGYARFDIMHVQIPYKTYACQSWKTCILFILQLKLIVIMKAEDDNDTHQSLIPFVRIDESFMLYLWHTKLCPSSQEPYEQTPGW